MLPNLINMLSWWQWLILGAVPPAILALYFLKLKRDPLEVPSTYLWRKSIEDLHVNSFWQKLRKNILLLLQLLLVLLIILALLRPSWHSTSLSGDRFVFLIDNSASMSSTDISPSRLDSAKQQVIDLIDQMRSGDKAMVISFHDEAKVVQEFTDNQRLLQRGVESIEPSEHGTSLLPALKLAGSASAEIIASGSDADGGSAGTLYLFSDGRFPNVEDVLLGNLKPVFIPVGTDEAENIGIVAFNTKRHETDADQVSVFFQLENASEKEQSVDAVLYRDNQQVDAMRVKVPAGKQKGFNFPALKGAAEGILRLEIRHDDPLAQDNRAYAVLETPRRGRVLLVTPGNEPVEWAIQTLEAQLRAQVTVESPEILQQESHLKAAAAGAYDLIIYDQCRPTEMPQANTLFIGRLPPEKGTGKILTAKGENAPDEEERRYSPWSTAKDLTSVEEAELPQVLDIDRNHPLMQLVELGSMFIGKSIILDPPAGATTLIDSTKGKIAAIAPRDGFEDMVLGFEIISAGEDGERLFNTDWWRRQSFPSFWLNVLGYLGGGNQSQTSLSLRPGEIAPLRSLTQSQEIQVVTPSGGRVKVARGKNNEFPFTDTEQTGVYEMMEGGQLAGRFAVNLFDPGESNILPRDGLENPIQIGPVEVTNSTNFESSRQETWKFLLVLALVILLLEWYIYNRRVYV